MQSNQGLTLDRYLEKKSPLDTNQATKITIQIAQQLGASSGSLLIHPGRILVTREGTVQLLPPPAEELALPAVVEYPAYASPEEIRGATPDVRSGLYSLGCTLYELLSGQPPYALGDAKQILHAHLESPVPEVSEKAPGISPRLGEVVRELLEKDPEQRIQTPQELIRRLKQSLGGGAAPAASVPAASMPAVSMPTVRPAAVASTRPVETLRATRAPVPAAAPAQTPAPVAARTPAVLKRTAALPPGKRAKPLSRAAAASTRKGSLARPVRSRAGDKLRNAQGSTLDEDLEAEEEEIFELTPPRRTFYFTAGGAVLGLLLGLMLVHFIKQKNIALDLDTADRKQQQFEKEHSDRKKVIADRDAVNHQKVSQLLAQAKARPPVPRKEILINGLSSLCETPYSHALAEELLKVWSAQPEATQAETAQLEDAFQKHKAEADKLEAEGRLGDAMEKWREKEKELSAHEKDITAAVLRLSDEITARWKATQIEADRLGLEGDPDKAVAELDLALKYGDGLIRREVERKKRTLQEMSAMRADTSDAKVPDEDPAEKKGASKDEKAGSTKGSGKDDFVDPDE